MNIVGSGCCRVPDNRLQLHRCDRERSYPRFVHRRTVRNPDVSVRRAQEVMTKRAAVFGIVKMVRKILRCDASK